MRRLLFVDFDGTITSEETLEGAMSMFLPQDMMRDGVRKLMTGEWALKDAVTFAFDNIPSSRLPEIMEYVRKVPVREGFGDLLDEMEKLAIPVVVISGGLKPYVEEKMEPYLKKILDIYSLDVDTSGDYIKLISPYAGTTDLMDKPTVMKKYDYDCAICVGDGLTDIQMARSSQVVFARGDLAKKLEEMKVPFTRWGDFHDVKRAIAEM